VEKLFFLFPFSNQIVCIEHSPPFMELEGSLPSLEETGTGPYPEPDESNPHYPTVFP
jgi:hypothetical protein